MNLTDLALPFGQLAFSTNGQRSLDIILSLIPDATLQMGL